MGAAVYVKLEKPMPGIDHINLVNGESIAHDWETLNELAHQQSIRSLEDFLSTAHDDLANLVGEDAVQASGVVLPPEQWFPASEGLATVRSLLDCLKSRPDSVRSCELVVRDLEAYRGVLEVASTNGMRFHFAFDF